MPPFATPDQARPAGTATARGKRHHALSHGKRRTPQQSATTRPPTACGFPIWTTPTLLQEKRQKQFRESMHQRFQQAADMGINTVYLHLRAFGDAYYCSQLFPPAAAVGDFDPLPILLEEAHRLHLSVHGWINPLRLQNDAGMGAFSDHYQVGQWYRDSQKNGTYLCKVGDYWWLNPGLSGSTATDRRRGGGNRTAIRGGRDSSGRLLLPHYRNRL